MVIPTEYRIISQVKNDEVEMVLIYFYTIQMAEHQIRSNPIKWIGKQANVDISDYRLCDYCNINGV